MWRKCPDFWVIAGRSEAHLWRRERKKTWALKPPKPARNSRERLAFLSSVRFAVPVGANRVEDKSKTLFGRSSHLGFEGSLR